MPPDTEPGGLERLGAYADAYGAVTLWRGSASAGGGVILECVVFAPSRRFTLAPGERLWIRTWGTPVGGAGMYVMRAAASGTNATGGATTETLYEWWDTYAMSATDDAYRLGALLEVAARAAGAVFEGVDPPQRR